MNHGNPPKNVVEIKHPADLTRYLQLFSATNLSYSEDTKRGYSQNVF